MSDRNLCSGNGRIPHPHSPGPGLCDCGLRPQIYKNFFISQYISKKSILLKKIPAPEVRFSAVVVSYQRMTKNEIEQIFKRHYAAMYRLAMLILRNEDDARDIVHDVFEALFSLDKTDVSGAYLLSSVRNRCLNHIRGLSSRRRIEMHYAVIEEEFAGDGWPDDETIALIQLTVAQDLSEATRRVVKLRFAEGKRYREIASSLGISEVAVYKHLRHAIDVLRKKLSQNG